MLELNFTPFPILQTERLILRQPAHDDMDDLFRMRSDQEVMRFIPRPLAQTGEEVLKLIRLMNSEAARNHSINWAITFRDQPGLAGIIGFPRLSREDHRGEIGYMLDAMHHRKGIMQEALTEVLKYGFESMGFHTIEGIIDPENIASERLLLKNGFTREAHFRENLLFEGRWMDSVHYTLFNRNT